MGSILNPTMENSFETLVNFKDKDIFVDKTDFIEKMSAKINADKRFFAVTRPRRFGKTVTAHMLLAYYSKGYIGKKYLTVCILLIKTTMLNISINMMLFTLI